MKNFFSLFLFFMIVTFTSNAQNDCNPATIINVVHEGSGNRLNWTMPTSGEEVVISQGGNYGDFGTGASEDFGVYHRFTTEDLVIVNEGKLTQFVFAPTYAVWETEPGHTYTIRIYKGGNWGEEDTRYPGILIFSQELSNANLLFNEENTITLENPVTIDPSQELWIGYHCTKIVSSNENMMSAGTDATPYKEGIGNVMFFQNQWYTLREIGGSGQVYNWCIKGIVQTIDGESVNIYCNGSNIADNISGTTYFHSNPTGEENCYKVEVNCLEGGVSILSNEVCIEGVGIKDNEQLGKFTVYPNPAKGELRIENGELKIENVDIFDIYGRNVGANLRVCPNENKINISALSAGVYFIRLSDGQSFSVQKFVKE